MSAQKQPSLPYAIRQLRNAVNRLTSRPSLYANNQYLEANSLYYQLQMAVEGQQSQTGSGSGSKSKPPIWIEPAQMLHNIDLMVNIWSKAVGSAPKQLREMAARGWTVEQAAEIRRKASIIEAWCDDIERLLSDEHGKHLSAPCPACGAESVLHRDSAGDMVRSPALAFQPGYQGVDCRNCQAYWDPSRFLLLADVLGIPRPEGVLE